MAREDDRLLDGTPMRPVSCRRCGHRVLVRKSSWHQTSVQWSTAAMQGCETRANGGGFEGCAALTDSIRAAALGGLIEVPDSEPESSR